MATERFIIQVETKGTRRASRNINSITTSAISARKALAFLRNALVLFASIQVFGKLVSGLADFAQAMATVQAVTGATDMAFRRLRTTAEELGATTRFTASEAAEGMVFLARAGFDTDQILGSIRDTLNLAAAGMIEMGKAADITSNIMSQFNLAAEESERVVDALTFTANNANTDILQLGQAMKFVGPIAAGLGIELETTTAALGILGDRGLQATLGGTGFRGVIAQLEAPTGFLLKALRATGTELSSVSVATVGLEEALLNVRRAGIGSQLALTAFGKRAGIAFDILSKNTELITRNAKATERASGITKQIAAIMDDNLAGALRATRSALEAILISMGRLGAEEGLTKFFFGLAEALRAVARNADKLVDALTVLVALFAGRLALAAITAGLIGLGGAFLALGTSVRSATGAVKLFSKALLAIPIVRVITAIGLIVAALVGFSEEIEVTNDGVIIFDDVLQLTSELLSEVVGPALRAVGLDVEDWGDRGSYKSYRQ
jgi:TP901 family phage tail tape measure protein